MRTTSSRRALLKTEPLFPIMDTEAGESETDRRKSSLRIKVSKYFFMLEMYFADRDLQITESGFWYIWIIIATTHIGHGITFTLLAFVRTHFCFQHHLYF